MNGDDKVLAVFGKEDSFEEELGERGLGGLHNFSSTCTDGTILGGVEKVEKINLLGDRKKDAGCQYDSAGIVDGCSSVHLPMGHSTESDSSIFSSFDRTLTVHSCSNLQAADSATVDGFEGSDKAEAVKETRALTGLSQLGVEKMEEVVKRLNSENRMGMEWPDFSMEGLNLSECQSVDFFEQKYAASVAAAGTVKKNGKGRGGSRKDGSMQEDSGASGSVAGKASSTGTGSNSRKKTKTDWTPELHRRFVMAVEQLGVDRAIPSRVLELMDSASTTALTRHNVATHLQKYRSHRRHLVSREGDVAAMGTWQGSRGGDNASWGVRMRRDGSAWSNPGPRPAVMGIMAGAPSPMGHPVPMPMSMAMPMPMPMPMPQPTPAVGMPMYVWGHPTVDHSPMHMWQQPTAPPQTPWYGSEAPMWNYPPMQQSLDAWGQPLQGPMAGRPLYNPPPHMRLHNGPTFVGDMPTSLQPSTGGDLGVGHIDSLGGFSDAPFSSLSDDLDLMLDVGDELLNLGEDSSCNAMLEEAISEALANPKTPPPLGLKLPSVENVMAELNRQGFSSASPSRAATHLSSASSTLTRQQDDVDASTSTTQARK